MLEKLEHSDEILHFLIVPICKFLHITIQYHIFLFFTIYTLERLSLFASVTRLI